MRINELISENEQLDEITAGGVGQGIGKFAGNVVRGTGNFFSGLKRGYQAARNKPETDDDTAASGRAAAAPAASGGTGGTTAAAASGGTGGAAASDNSANMGQVNKIIPSLGKTDLENLKKNIDGLIAQKSKEEPQQGQAQQSAPGGQAVDLDQLKQQRQAKQAQGQADQQQAMQQMQQTQQANVQSSQADAQLKAAVKAAKAKPGFQQTAQDKLTIQQGAEKGIHESKKKKVVREFKSKFLGIKI